MKNIQSLIYLSGGNLPSQWAHSKQIAKMSLALSKKIKKFELITSGDVFSFARGMDQFFMDWYSLNRKFKLVRLPVSVRSKRLYPKDYANSTYYKMALAYISFKLPSLVYIRTNSFIEPLIRKQIPVLWECHETIEDNSSIIQYFTDKNLIGLVTLSSETANNYIRQGFPPEKILIIHSAVDLADFAPHQSKLEARKKLGLNTTSKIVVYSGHLYTFKGVSTILSTASSMPDVNFLLVGGWDEDVQRVREECQSKGLTNVTLTGHVQQSKLVTYLYAADVLILPTSRAWTLADSTSPLKLFEYMAAKRAIVASSLPNVSTLLKDGHNALLVEPDEYLAFNSAISRIFENLDLADRLSQNAFNDVRGYTWDTRTEKILEFISSRL